MFALGVFAQGPNGSGSYYQNASGKKGSALKTALFNIISKNVRDVGYDGLLSAYHTTDKRPDGYLRDWYSPSNKFEIGGPAEIDLIKKRVTAITASIWCRRAGLVAASQRVILFR